MPVNHIGITVADMAANTTFYEAALKPLGYTLKRDIGPGVARGYGTRCSGPDFWIAAAKDPLQATGSQIHFAFNATSRAQVRAFHAAAVAAGGVCNGPPGLRPEYFATYYGAFVRDPDGRNVEAVCMAPGFWAEAWSWGAIAGAAVAAVGVSLVVVHRVGGSSLGALCARCCK